MQKLILIIFIMSLIFQRMVLHGQSRYEIPCDSNVNARSLKILKSLEGIKETTNKNDAAKINEIQAICGVYKGAHYTFYKSVEELKLNKKAIPIQKNDLAQSSFNYAQKNGKSQGLMQINGGSFEPVENVTAGSKILANLIAKSMNEGNPTPVELATYYDNQPQKAANCLCGYALHRSLTAYNRGWAGANRYKAKTGTFTSEYSKKVLKMYNKFKELEQK